MLADSTYADIGSVAEGVDEREKSRLESGGHRFKSCQPDNASEWVSGATELL
jgi:hypothetical protein